jgi:Glycosyltransferase family 10 (fucosyltransferase) C-term
MRNPIVAVLPYELRYTASLGDIKIVDLVIPLAGEIPTGIHTVSDLTDSDHLIVFCCWKALARKHSDISCRINLLVAEPRAVQARYYFLIPFFAKKFHSILTFSERLIERIPNGIFHPGASLWVEPKQVFEKRKLISVIASRKAKTKGQRLRHKIIQRCKSLGIHLDLYGRGYKEIEKKEDALTNYMFSVCIENSSERNYFTEKIVDCLAQKVVPIYWGAPNIGDFFTLDGIILCRSEEEIVSAIKNITQYEYRSRLAAIEVNYTAAKTFKSLEYMAAKKISETIGLV